MFSNADQLTSPKMCELHTKIQQEHPMIVAICEVKPKNAVKERSEQVKFQTIRCIQLILAILIKEEE